MYLEFEPSAQVSDLVDSFWSFKGAEKSEKFKILPDNCMDFIFDLRYDKAYLCGVMSSYRIHDSMPDSNLLGIRFNSERLGSISSVPAIETRNLRIDLEHAYPKDAIQIVEKLDEKANLSERLKFLEKFVLGLKGKIDLKEDQTILEIAKSIRASKGTLRIRDLATRFHLSLRQFERRFKTVVGLTPKEYSNIVRLHEAKKKITESCDFTFLNIAYEMGYYDSSHMTKEFQRLAGDSPSFFQ